MAKFGFNLYPHLCVHSTGLDERVFYLGQYTIFGTYRI